MKDILIIGAGTAGMTAALYALRNGKSVLLVEGGSVGGQIASSPRVENFPSVKSISGAELSDKLYEQVSDLGAEFEFDTVRELSRTQNGFSAKGEYGDYEGRSVIIATGVKHKKLNAAHEEEFEGRGVSYCAVCDGPFYSGEEVAVVGDGNSALQYALMLAGYCKKVHVLTWMDRFFGDKALSDALLKKPNVEWVKEVTCDGFEGDDDGLNACVLTDRNSGEKRTLPVKACFVAIGQLPDNNAFSGLVALDKDGYIAANESCTTSTDGVFVAGDCRTKAVRQLTTAVADGATAALAAVRFLT